MTEIKMPALAGKIIAVKYGHDDFDYLEVVGIEDQAGRPFLVAKTVSVPGYRKTEGLRVCVAWDSVTAYYEFDSIEHYHECIEAWYSTTKKPRIWGF